MKEEFEQIGSYRKMKELERVVKAHGLGIADIELILQTLKLRNSGGDIRISALARAERVEVIRIEAQAENGASRDEAIWPQYEWWTMDGEFIGVTLGPFPPREIPSGRELRISVKGSMKSPTKQERRKK